MTSPRSSDRPAIAAMQAYRLIEPEGAPGSAIFSSPHSGRAYPASLLTRTRLDPLALRASEDAFVDELFAVAPSHGAPLIAAEAPRALIDLNRSPKDLDPAVIEGVRASALNARVAAGLGVIPRVVAEGAPIYDGKISLVEARRRIEAFHAPYHSALRTLLKQARALHGEVVLFDCHSMPRDALKAVGGRGGRRPEIVIGDRFGAAASNEVANAAVATFSDAGFVVARNTPFAGGHITQTYGRPSRGVHAIQIEIDRGLYLDEANVRKSAGFTVTRHAIADAVAKLCGLPRARRALAAE